MNYDKTIKQLEDAKEQIQKFNSNQLVPIIKISAVISELEHARDKENEEANRMGEELTLRGTINEIDRLTMGGIYDKERARQ